MAKKRSKSFLINIYKSSCLQASARCLSRISDMGVHRLKELLRKKLIERGWRDELKEYCKGQGLFPLRFSPVSICTLRLARKASSYTLNTPLKY